MKVKIINKEIGMPVGHIIDVKDHVAARWCDEGYAELIQAIEQPKKPTPKKKSNSKKQESPQKIGAKAEPKKEE